ncbi:M23 family metallopeptidase [Glycomyces sp. NPDC049804]|uniref:M23 family metallopeptidase n=1 Tax=Glycomyces sp. NPDC049804 TaxID=3154363 RepID=UPI003442ED8D
METPQESTAHQSGSLTGRRLKSLIRRGRERGEALIRRGRREALIQLARIRRDHHRPRLAKAGLGLAVLVGVGLASAVGQHAAAQAAGAQVGESQTVVQGDWAVDTVLADMSAAAKAEKEKAAAEKAAAEAAAAEAARLAALPWTLPSDARITSYYGMRDGRLHGGTDFGDFEGEEIWSVGEGTVTYVGFEPGGYGNVVYIDHGNGVQTRYAHASKVLVKVGDKVGKGETVILAGNTGGSRGPHLHFEVLIGGKKVDSLAWLEKQGLNPG